jgi:hypothetical protein
MGFHFSRCVLSLQSDPYSVSPFRRLFNYTRQRAHLSLTKEGQGEVRHIKSTLSSPSHIATRPSCHNSNFSFYDPRRVRTSLDLLCRKDGSFISSRRLEISLASFSGWFGPRSNAHLSRLHMDPTISPTPLDGVSI